MLSFELYPFSYFVLTGWHGLSCFVECIEGHFSMFFDKSVSFLYCLIVCDACWLFSCAWMISQEEFVGALLGGHVRPPIMHEGCNRKPHIPVILSCRHIHSAVLFDPLILSFCEPISLWVKSGANISPYA